MGICLLSLKGILQHAAIFRSSRPSLLIAVIMADSENGRVFFDLISVSQICLCRGLRQRADVHQKTPIAVESRFTGYTFPIAFPSISFWFSIIENSAPLPELEMISRKTEKEKKKWEKQFRCWPAGKEEQMLSGPGSVSIWFRIVLYVPFFFPFSFFCFLNDSLCWRFFRS